jgi:uncharacterized protein
MNPNYQTDLYQRLHAELSRVPCIDTHEHLQRESELPQGESCHIGRFFEGYANSDLISAGMPPADMSAVLTNPKLSPKERFCLLAPWYQKAWNTAYCEALRIAWRDLFDVEDLAESTVDTLTERMRAMIKPGWTRQVFDKAGIDYAMHHSFGPHWVANPDYDVHCFICDMVGNSLLDCMVPQISEETGIEILDLGDYLKAIDWYFEQYAAQSGAFKIHRAYYRPLFFADVPRSHVEETFTRRIAPDYMNLKPSAAEILALEDFIVHYLCRKCNETGLPLKFHSGLFEGNGNLISHGRAELLSNLFVKYPNVRFDIFHISYPYQEELAAIAKMFPNVTVDFCWMWAINPAAGRRALADMLETVPANKIHGFGGDYSFVEGSYGHKIIAVREITRVLCEKVEEGRFSEEHALKVGRMLLRDNPLENFKLAGKRG